VGILQDIVGRPRLRLSAPRKVGSTTTTLAAQADIMPRCSTGLTGSGHVDLPPWIPCAPDRSLRGSISCWTRPLSFGNEPSRSRWIGRTA
jgi:hypothetical protein